MNESRTMEPKLSRNIPPLDLPAEPSLGDAVFDPFFPKDAGTGDGRKQTSEGADNTTRARTARTEVINFAPVHIQNAYTSQPALIGSRNHPSRIIHRPAPQGGEPIIRTANPFTGGSTEGVRKAQPKKNAKLSINFPPIRFDDDPILPQAKNPAPAFSDPRSVTVPSSSPAPFPPAQNYSSSGRTQSPQNSGAAGAPNFNPQRPDEVHANPTAAGTAEPAAIVADIAGITPADELGTTIVPPTSADQISSLLAELSPKIQELTIPLSAGPDTVCSAPSPWEAPSEKTPAVQTARAGISSFTEPSKGAEAKNVGGPVFSAYSESDSSPFLGEVPTSDVFPSFEPEIRATETDKGVQEPTLGAPLPQTSRGLSDPAGLVLPAAETPAASSGLRAGSVFRSFMLLLLLGFLVLAAWQVALFLQPDFLKKEPLSTLSVKSCNYLVCPELRTPVVLTSELKKLDDGRWELNAQIQNQDIRTQKLPAIELTLEDSAKSRSKMFFEPRDYAVEKASEPLGGGKTFDIRLPFSYSEGRPVSYQIRIVPK